MNKKERARLAAVKQRRARLCADTLTHSVTGDVEVSTSEISEELDRIIALELTPVKLLEYAATMGAISRKVSKRLAEYEGVMMMSAYLPPRLYESVILERQDLRDNLAAQTIAESVLISKSVTRGNGGKTTAEARSAAAADEYAKIYAAYLKLLNDDQSDKQAVLTLIERGHGSESKIRRALKAMRNSDE